MRILILACVLFVIPVAAQESRPAAPVGPIPSQQDVDAAILKGASILVGLQESYGDEGNPARAGQYPRLKTDDARFAHDEKVRGWLRSKQTAQSAEWPYEGVYREKGVIPPGYRVGGTSIACLALLAAPEFANDKARRASFDKGLEFVLKELEKNPDLFAGFNATYDVRGWAHAYGLELCLTALDMKVLKPEVATRAERMAKTLVRVLEETEIKKTGGWNYARRGGYEKPTPASPFMTAPTLMFLFHAKARGLSVDASVVDRALKSIEEARLDNEAFQYSTNPSRKSATGGDDVPGACARMAAAELVLHLAGRGGVDRIRRAVDAFFTHWGELEVRRRQSGTHIPPYMIAPYYFHFGHRYAALAIEQLPENERPALRDRLRATYWKTRESNGAWNDREFVRSESFGTAMAMLGLATPNAPAPAVWKP